MAILDGWDRTARDGFGQPVSGVDIDVRVAQDPADENAGTIQRPTLYADAYGNSSKANPFQTPTDGRILFHAPDGVYHVVVDDGDNKRVYRNVQIGQGLAALRRVQTVESRSNGGPPASPALGDTFIVDTATGDWSGFNVGDLASYIAGAWTAASPVVGTGPVYVRDEDISLRYAASLAWEQSGGGGGGTVTPDRYLALINDVAEARDSAGRALARYESVHYDPFVASSDSFLVNKTDTEIANEILQMTVFATVYAAEFGNHDHKVLAGATGGVTDTYSEPGDFIRAFAVSDENLLFSIAKESGTTDRELRKYDAEGNVLVFKTDPNSLDVFSLGPSTIYVGSTTSFFTFDRDWSNQSSGITFANELKDIAADNNDDAFFAARQAYKYDNASTLLWNNPFNLTAFEALAVDGSSNQYVGRRDSTVGNDSGDTYFTTGAVTAIGLNPNGRVIAGTQSGYLLQLDSSMGAFLETQVAGGAAINAIAGDGNNYTFAAFGDGVIRKHDSSGGLLASYDTGDAECLTIARNGNGKIFVGTDSSVLMLNATLSLDYQTGIPSSAGGITGNGSNEAFVGLTNGDVIHLDNTGSQIASITLSSATDGSEAIVGAGITGNGNVLMGTRGQQSELLDGSDITASPLTTISRSTIENDLGADAAVLDVFAAGSNALWLSFLEGETKEYDQLGNSRATGFSSIAPGLDRVAAKSDGSVCYFGGDTDAIIAALDGATGDIIWTNKIDRGSATSTVALALNPDEDVIYAAFDDSTLSELDLNGTEINKWNLTVPAEVITFDAFGALYYVDANDELAKMDMNNKPNDEWRDTSLNWSNNGVDAVTIPEATATATTRTESLAYVPATVHLYRSTENINAGGSIVFTAEDGDGNTKTLSDGENDVSNFTDPNVFATITFTRNDDFSGPRLLEYGLLWSE